MSYDPATKPTLEEVEHWLHDQRVRLDALIEDGVNEDVIEDIWENSIAYRIARAYVDLLEEKRLHESMFDVGMPKVKE